MSVASEVVERRFCAMLDISNPAPVRNLGDGRGIYLNCFICHHSSIMPMLRHLHMTPESVDITACSYRSGCIIDLSLIDKGEAFVFDWDIEGYEDLFERSMRKNRDWYIRPSYDFFKDKPTSGLECIFTGAEYVLAEQEIANGGWYY